MYGQVFRPVDGKFCECATCAAKAGSPELCGGCYNNRTLIGRLEEQNRQLRRRLSASDIVNDALFDHITNGSL